MRSLGSLKPMSCRSRSTKVRRNASRHSREARSLGARKFSGKPPRDHSRRTFSWLGPTSASVIGSSSSVFTRPASDLERESGLANLPWSQQGDDRYVAQRGGEVGLQPTVDSQGCNLNTGW